MAAAALAAGLRAPDDGGGRGADTDDERRTGASWKKRGGTVTEP